MTWYNYKALSVNTALDSKAILTPNDLESFINGLGPQTTLYHCYYELEKRQTYVNYEGLLRPAFDTIHIDLDSDDGGLKALDDTRLLVKRLEDAGTKTLVYFSGNKGFHIAIHKSSLNIDALPKAQMEGLVKTLLQGLQSIYPTVDLRIWNANRKFRAYKSRHEKSGLYKTVVSDLSLSIEDIRELAKTQSLESYCHPTKSLENPWLLSLMKSSPEITYQKVKQKEVSQGQTIDDDSLSFRNFKEKKCIKDMLSSRTLPQFNRHDIGLRLIYDAKDSGVPLEQALQRLTYWANEVFPGDQARIDDTLRQVADAYTKPQEYKFGCYDDIKKAYCNAKCGLYSKLDRLRRAQPLNCTKAQVRENLEALDPLKKVSEGELADQLLSELGDVCKVSGDYFKWRETHWERIDRERFEYMMSEFAVRVYGNRASSKQLSSLINQIKLKIPVAPESNCFYSASLNMFNFTDCTAIVRKDDKGSIVITTKAHDKKDYLAYCAPFPLKAETSLPRSGEFLHYLKTREEDLGIDGLRIIKQMLGAALIPYVPRIFFIVGKTNSGKSTLALIIKRLLGSANVSEVAPVKNGMGGDRFNWEPSIGKLANIVTELDDKETLDVNTLKKVRDKTAIDVDRKGLKKVQATLPFLHIYCCNELPPSLEGNTGALNNRVNMLYFKPGYLNGLSDIQELGEHLWSQDAGTILDVAREGLADLVKTGFRYYESDASKAAVKEWQKTTDSVELFVEDLQNGEAELVLPEASEFVKGALIYEAFEKWSFAAGRRAVLGKHKFYRQLVSKYDLEHRTRGEGGFTVKIGSLFEVKGSEF